MGDDFATLDLVEADLHLLLEPSVVGQQTIHGFLNEFICLPAGVGGKLAEGGFLGWGEVHFHRFTVATASKSVKTSGFRVNT